jgi:hypothetical protein
VVFSSTLVRAMETALYQFPGMTVYPVPFVKEVSSDPPDLPQSVADQKKVSTKTHHVRIRRNACKVKAAKPTNKSITKFPALG